MIKTVQVSLPAERTDSVLNVLQSIEGVQGIKLQRNISLKPEGDVITIEALNRSLPQIMRKVESIGLGTDSSSSVIISDIKGIITSENIKRIFDDSSELSWEEMELTIGKESNMNINALLVMLISGILAAVGIITNAIHLVIGAMLIAPGFEPISRIAAGIVSGSSRWHRGVVHTFMAYAAFAAGSIMAFYVMSWSGHHPPSGDSSYLKPNLLVQYWSVINISSVIVMIVASGAGAVLILADKSILTAGVMVALSLIPSASMASMGAASGDWQLFFNGLQRWILEASVITTVSVIIFYWKRVTLYKRRSIM